MAAALTPEAGASNGAAGPDANPVAAKARNTEDIERGTTIDEPSCDSGLLWIRAGFLGLATVQYSAAPSRFY